MDRKKFIAPLVGLALLTKNSGDLCTLELVNEKESLITNPQTLNLFCQIDSFNPEHPETQIPNINLSSSPYSVVASGTTLSLVDSQSLFKLK